MNKSTTYPIFFPVKALRLLSILALIFCYSQIAQAQCNITASWSDYSLGGDSMRFYAHDTNSTAHHVWVWGDGTSTSGTIAVNHHYSQSGTYHVCFYVYIPNTSCSDSLCQTVVVPQASSCHANFGYQIIANTDSVVFTSSSTSTDSILSYSWHFGDGTYGSGLHANHHYAQPGTYIVCLSFGTASGCQSSKCDTIIIPATTNPCNLNAGWTYTNLGGDSIRFIGQDTSSATHHDWNFGDGTYSSSNDYHPSHTYANAGTYHVCLFVYTGSNCVDSFCQTVVVANTSSCHITADWFSYYLGGDSVRFYTADTNTAAHHIWNWGDGTSTSGTMLTNHRYAQPGVYHVCLYVYLPNTSCSDSLCKNVTVSAPPCTTTASWQFYSLGGDSLRFYAADTNTAAHHIWNWGDGTYTSGTTLTNHHYSQAGTYHVCLIVYIPNTSCTDSFCQNVTITAGAPCNIRWGWQYTSNGGDSASFYAEDTVSAAHHYWNFGDGVTSTVNTTHPTHVYANPGTYHVCFYVYIPNTTCTDSFCQNVTIVGSTPCHVNAAWSHYALGGDSVRFYSHDTNSVAHHVWVWGDGSYTTGLTVTNHTYAQAGTYHVCYYVYIPNTNCSDSLCDNITVGSNTSQCNITANWTSYSIGGDSVRFHGADTNTAAHHIWSFGDGSYSYSVTTINHTYAHAGTYHVCFYVYLPNTSCIDSSCSTVTIVASTPPCTTTATWHSYAAGGDTVNFYAADTNTAAHHVWVWGDGSYTTGVTHTSHVYAQAGTYHVCLYVYVPNTNCSDSLCDNVTVAGNPCHITSVWHAYGIGGDSVMFYAMDTNTAAHHVWVWGDGSYTTGVTHTMHHYADTGVYHVCLYVYLPGTYCVDSACNDVRLTANGHFQLSAIWSSNPLGGDTVGFTAATSDTSTAAYTVWYFGDGSFAFNTTNPTHVYATSGTYNVCFITFIPNTDFADTVCQTINIVLGLNNISVDNVRIITQPNPFNQSILIRTEGLTGTFDLKVYDVVGQLLRTEKAINGSFTMQRGDLTSGMYLFEISQNGKVIGTGKIVAQ